jgi:hypothetical protein
MYAPGTKEHNRALKPLAGDDDDYFFGVIVSVKGDLDYVSKAYKLANYRALTTNPCALCPCCTALECMWSDLRRIAAWIDRLFSADEWSERNPRPMALFTLPGVTGLTYSVDIMHCKHCGTDMYFLGSVLCLLVYFVLTAGTPIENLQHVFRMIQEFYSANLTRARYQNLKLSMFTDPEKPSHGYPKLKGQCAEVRHLGPALLSVWSSLMDAGSMVRRQVRLGLRLSCRIDEILDEHVSENRLPR